MVLAILLGVTAILWQPISVLLTTQDTSQLKDEVESLGLLAPVAFLALSIIQIVGAPIPGYPVQFLGGVLFGTLMGGIYGVIGMALGGLISAWLARNLGRPFVEKHVAPQTLAKYENPAKLESLGTWIVILLIPLGDVPYYIAGLSRVKLKTLFWAIILSRGPFTFIFTWAGANSIEAPKWITGALLALILTIVAVGYLSRHRVSLWVDTHVLHRLQ